jgi:two-component system response regulator DevR
LARPQPLRVFLVAPKPLVEQGLRSILAVAEGLEIIGSARDFAGVELNGTKPHLVLLDLDGLNLEVEEAIATCERVSPHSRICVLSTRFGVDDMQRALAARADAYIVKDSSPRALVEILRSVADGDFYADPRIAGILLRRRSGRGGSHGDLSTRENEIVRLIAAGLSNRDIGDRLSLSEKTVKNHISHIFAKLKITARSHAAVYAIRNGLVR